MKKAKFILTLVLLYASAARAYELPLSTGVHRVVFSSDQGDFNENTRVINLQGNVQLDELGPDEKLTKTIKARRLTVNSSSNTIYAPEDFVLNDASGTIYGKSGVFDYAANTGYINDGRLAYAGFFFSGKRVELSPGRYVYKKARLTSCDETPPHFKIRASRIYLVPGKYFLTYNNLFYLGRVPIFYFPVLYKPLGGGTPFVSSFHFGHDNRSGYFAKSTYAYKFNPETRGKLYLDYFSKKSFGTGGEVDYQKKEKTNANLSMYRIRESGTSHDRWGMNGGYWHSLNRFNESDPVSYYSQSSFRLLSDPEFNNDYFRANPFAVSPDKQASLAFTRGSNTTVTRVSAATKYERSSDLVSFDKSYESAPRLDFQKLPFTIGKIPGLHSFNGFFENAKEAGTPYFQRKGRGAWTVSQTLPLARSLTMLPSASYDQSLAIATSAVTTDQWIGRYGVNTNIRYDRLWGSLDLGYSYLARMVVNRLGKDRTAADKGEELRSLSSQLFITPVYTTYFKAGASYDMRDGMGGSFSRRLSTMTVEFYHAPRKNLDIYLQDSYRFGDGNKSFVAQVYSGDEKNYLGVGLAHYSSQPHDYVLNQMMGFRVPWAQSWRAEGVLRYKLVRFTAPGDKSVNFFEKGLVLYKDFHDFHTSWHFMVRRGVNEFHFLVSLKMNDSNKRDPLEDSSRNYWHPWRKDGELRD
ncbi:MAG: hypothetical protein A2270_03230 [Elusimicrobia bacterium RIFOXYA12_FULL_51_18]|nr:MAG: hypothetical protein A2270_03230 [Elusimicrobia bacterium RIFOXYA12_FULL_51_18]OGS31860.1 MAG: hypothetical protein A2218_06195 [Elusimicrobia bacterium RIFOXYA2_FULL_53_38]